MNIRYQNYVNKVIQMALTANYKQQLKFIQSSPKFNQGEVVEFPGYTIITPPAKEDTFNLNINQYLQELQEIIKTTLKSNLLLPVPPETFHMTLSVLICDKS